MLKLTILSFIILLVKNSTQEPPPLPKNILISGRQLPSIGFGTNGLDDELKALTAVVQGVDCGFRVFDTAHIFDNKVAVGLGLKQQIVAKRVTRKDLFIIGKVWNTYHSRPQVVDNIKHDLRDLDLDYLDLGLLNYPTSFKYSCHDKMPKYENGSFIPMNFEKDVAYLEAYRGLEAAYMLGLVCQIGLANFNIRQLNKIFDMAFVRPVVLEIECHPLFRNDKLVKFAKANNMTVICSAPLRMNTPELTSQSVLKELADKYKKSVQQIALRWNMQRGTVVIPRSNDRRHQRDNIEALNFALDDSDMGKINGISEASRVVDLPGLSNHPDYPFGPNADAE